MGQQLVQVARAARHRVVQHHVVLPRPAVLARHILLHHAQVVDLAAEATLQPQLQRRHEGLHDAFIDSVLGVGHEDAQRLGFELAIEVEALEQVRWVIAALLRAIEAVRLLGRLSVAPGWLLHLTAVPTQSESWPRRLLISHLEGLARLGELTEVHIAEGHPRDELETEGQGVRGNLPGLTYAAGQEVRHQLAHVILRFAVLGAVVDAHFRVVAVGNRLAESQQRAALRRVAPHRLAAARAHRMNVRLHAQVLHVVAARAKTPVLGLGEVHVDLVDFHTPLVRVEAVFRGELGQRRLRRALVLQRIERDVTALARLVDTTAAPQHGLQLHPGFRKGVVRNQPVVGHRAEQVARVDFLDELEELVALSQQLVDFRLGRLVLWLLLELLDRLVELVLALLVAAPLLLQLGQRLHQAAAQAIRLALALHEIQQPRPHHFIHIAVEQLHEAVEESLLVGQHMVDEQVGEAVELARLHHVQRLRGLVRQCVMAAQTCHPVVHAVGEQLPAQHLGRLQEDARRRHFASNHLLGLGKEVEVVRAVAISQGGGHRVAVATPRPAHPLQKTRLVRRHRAQQHRRQAADVHAHLQRRRCGEQVFVPGARLLVLEAVLQRLSFRALQQACVLGRDHPPQVTVAEALRPPIRCIRNQRLVACIEGIQAGHADQVLGILARHRQATLASFGRDEGHLTEERQRVRVQGQGVAQVVAGLDKHALGHQQADGLIVEVCRHALGQQHLRPEHHARPALVPGLPPGADELVEIAMLAERHEDGPRRVRAHPWQPLPSPRRRGQGKHVAVGRIHAQLRVQHTAALTHAGEHPPQPLGNGGLLDALRAVLLAEHFLQPLSQRFESRPRHRQHRLADPLEGPSALAQVGQVAEELPQQALLHLGRQATVGRQVVLLQQLDRPVVLPSHVRAEELRHQPRRLHVQDRARRIELGMCPLDESRPGHRLEPHLIHHMRPSGAHVVHVGSGAEEARAVRRVLHRIREGNQLLVVIEGAGPTVLHHLRAQRRVTRTEELKLAALAAGRAGLVVMGVRPLTGHAGPLRRHPVYRHEGLMPTGETRLLALLHVTAAHAHVLFDPLGEGTANAAHGVKVCCLRRTCKPSVVNHFQIGRQLTTGLYLSRNPTRGAALPALHHGQIHPIAFARQIPLTAQLDLFRIGRELADHAAQLPHPHLHTQRDQRLIALSQGPGHEHQQRVEHLPDLALAGVGHIAGEGLGQHVVARHPALEELEQVHEQLVALEQCPKGFAPRGVAHVRRRWLVREEEAKPRSHRRLGRTVARGFQRIGPFAMEAEHEVHHRVFQEHSHRLAVLHHHRIGLEGHAEHLPRVLAQRRGIRAATQRCRGSGAN